MCVVAVMLTWCSVGGDGGWNRDINVEIIIGFTRLPTGSLLPFIRFSPMTFLVSLTMFWGFSFLIPDFSVLPDF